MKFRLQNVVRVEFCNFVRVNFNLLNNLFTSGFFFYFLVCFISNLFCSYTPYIALKQDRDTLSIVFINGMVVFEFILIVTFLSCQASKCSCFCKSPNFKVVWNSNNCDNLCDQSSLADGECGGQGYVSLYEKCK